ncbi:PREDICTED: uncharacterized protein LOC107339904 [Acropora digitifera]|uniref:uncharacterized protein LOC107339904 n=1 Tax=Acropora digitifera TaxID=70779 RepID=UPI00077A1005|nr:PREDICTED: uncharacterized protein LOC107339904 [Acropora digitifera]
MSTVVLFSVYMWIALFSAETTSSTFDLCGINEITGENFTLSLNFSTENANKTGNECSRAIILKSKRIKFFVEEAKFASGVVFEIQDGPFMNQGMKLWPKPRGDNASTFLSSSNAIFIRFKDVSGGGNGASSFQGRISSVPYQDKCHCRGVKNGKMECSESEAERRCEVKCNDSYMELSMNQDMICNLAREEWDIDVNHVPLSCQKIQPPLNIKATVNINYTNSTCEQLDVGKIANVFQAFLLKNNTIGSKGMCFRAGGEDKIQCNRTRLQVNCTTMNTSSSTQVTIIDQILEPTTLIEASKNFQDLFAAYNNLNFKELLASKELAPGSGNISTMIIANDSFVSMVSPWCGVDNDFIRLAANQSFFVCSTCPTNHFYNITAHVCEKCPPGTFASSRARSCSQQNSTLLIPLKFSCDNKCMKGKHVDGKSWMCEWCPMDTYQNSSTKVNPDCTPCPGEKKTRFPGAQDITECRDPCPNGTYLNISSGTCFKCPVGSYMDVHSHVFERCKSCGRKKITQATGSKTISDCYECMKGSFYNSSSKSCSLCPEGKYQDEVNQDTCKDCDRGKTTLDHGTNTSSDCVVVCGLGQYLNDSDEACLDCPFNTYMDSAKHRSKECKACGPNEITNATGTSNISQCFGCRKGTFLNKTVSQCQRCPKGTFQDQPGQDKCTQCPDTMSTDNSGQWSKSACVAICGKGEFYDSSDNRCKPCSYGTYQESENHQSTSCKVCPRQGAVDFKQCAKFELVKMSLRFTSLSWTDELENTSNAFYQKKKMSIEKAIRFELRKDPSFQSVIVTGMMRGSIIADFDLFFNEKVGYFPAEALQTAALDGRVGNLSVAPDSLKILHQDCAQPLGMENRKVKNDQITASNYLKNYEPYEGRLNINGGRGWQAEYTRKKKEYLQIDFKREVNITGVATQGQSTSNLFVKQYKLSTSDDGKKWIKYTENGTSQMLNGNQDSKTVVRNNLATTITTRYIRFLPQTWNERIFMRVEVYGCLPNALKRYSTLTDVAAVKTTEDGWPWGAYLGIVFAALLVIGIVVSVFFWKKKSKEKQYRSEVGETLVGMDKVGAEYKVVQKDAAESVTDDEENLV